MSLPDDPNPEANWTKEQWEKWDRDTEQEEIRRERGERD